MGRERERERKMGGGESEREDENKYEHKAAFKVFYAFFSSYKTGACHIVLKSFLVGHLQSSEHILLSFMKGR